MIAKREIWNYAVKSDVWIGRYLNSRNLPHWHSDCELISVENGEIEVVCENKIFVLTGGDALFINSEQVHYMSAKSPNTILQVIIFNYGIVKEMLNGKNLSNAKLEGYDVNSLYLNLKKELENKRLYYNEAAKYKIATFFIEILRKEKTETKKEKSVYNRLKLLLDKINDEYDTITFSDAYAFMAMDEAYFCRYFKKATGMSFTQYLNHIKIDSAVKLLQEDNPPLITSVAVDCGFGSIRHFNKTFKEITGFAPTALPRGYVLTRYSFHTDNEFNPTLQGCELLEQF